VDIPKLVQYGDVWELGNHLLICGDCTSPLDVERLMSGDKADLCFTSPPYDKQRSYGGQQFDWTQLMSGMSSCLPMKPAGQVIVNLGLIHKHGEWVEYWAEWMKWMRSQCWRQFGWYVWHQGEGLPGDWNGRLAPCFEFLFHFNREARRANKITPCKYAGRISTGTTMKDSSGVGKPKTQLGVPTQPFKIPDSVVSVMREKRPGLNTAHPAVFPVALPAHIIQAYTNPEDVVYEPFSGGGTTIIAAEQTGRRCRAVEIVPEYCDIALERWRVAYGTPRLLHREDSDTFVRRSSGG
jgi:DNA modification methylase